MESQKNLVKSSAEAGFLGRDRIVVTYYTDPLCCWCWAFEKEWQQFIDEHAERLKWTYVMGGMIQDWKTFSDPMHAVSKPVQMGPVWMHAGEVSRTKINPGIWHKDPPSSSYPSCIAFKAAQLQSEEAANLLLSKMRNAVMLEGRNIARKDVILSLAETVTEEISAFDIRTFDADFLGTAGRAGFKLDLQKAAYYKIARFPSLTFENAAGKGIIISGFRPLEMLEAALAEIELL